MQTSQPRRICIRLACIAATSSLLHMGAMAQEWPSKPVKLVIATAAGSSGDTLSRMLAPRLEALWKQPVIVENKPGAGGVIGTEYVTRATDGHTLLLGSLSSLLPKYTVKNLRYDPLNDLVPVYRILNFQFVIVTNSKTAEKAKTLQEIVQLGKSTPQGLFFAGSGPTSIFNLSMAVVNKQLGIPYTTVDFNNVPAQTMAVLQNEAQLMVNAPGAIKGQLDSKDLHAVAAISAERYPNLPNVPTVVEAGYKGFMPLSWASVFAPKGTPTAVTDRIGRDLLTILSDQDFKKSIETRLTATVLRSSPAAFAKEFLEDASAWKSVIESMNYVPQ